MQVGGGKEVRSLLLCPLHSPGTARPWHSVSLFPGSPERDVPSQLYGKSLPRRGWWLCGAVTIPSVTWPGVLWVQHVGESRPVRQGCHRAPWYLGTVTVHSQVPLPWAEGNGDSRNILLCPHHLPLPSWQPPTKWPC